MPLSAATKATIQKELPSEIANIVTLPVEELKHRLIGESGLTLAAEEEILEEAKNPEITSTLKNKKDIAAYYDQFNDE